MIHHISIITAKTKENVDFYTKTLGMKFVKKTVNFDDPFTYHIYYGNEDSEPGSIVTFFIHPGSELGKKGKGIAHGFILQVPQEIYNKLGDKITDPDGLLIKLKPGDKHFILGVLTTASKDFHEEFNLDSESEFIESNEIGEMGAGVLHHTAFFTKDESSQLELREKLSKRVNVTPVIDRFYFKSVYMQEPNGCIIEIATEGPGFFVDEDNPGEMGKELRLPPQFRDHREEIEKRLPPL